MNYFGKAAMLLPLFGPGHAPVADPAFARLAEGYTSADTRAGIVAAQRMFSVPTFGEICAPLQPPTRLVAGNPEPVRLVRNEWFSYDRLVVYAVGASGGVLPSVPIAVEVEDVTPPVLNLRAEFTADPDGRVMPIRAGSFRFRFTTLCAGHSAVVVLKAEVTEPRLPRAARR